MQCATPVLLPVSANPNKWAYNELSHMHRPLSKYTIYSLSFTVNLRLTLVRVMLSKSEDW